LVELFAEDGVLAGLLESAHGIEDGGEEVEDEVGDIFVIVNISIGAIPMVVERFDETEDIAAIFDAADLDELSRT